MGRDNRRCGERDRALRALRDAHRAEYDGYYRAAVKIEGLGRDAVWRARRRAFVTLRDAHRAEYDECMRLAGGRVAKPCRICGTDVWIEKRLSCGDPFCVRAIEKLRYVLDIEQRARHALVNARWAAEYGRPAQRRYAKRVLAGQRLEGPKAGQRWLTAVSGVHLVALECVLRDLPVIGDFPEWVLTQLQAEAEAYLATPGTMKFRASS